MTQKESHHLQPITLIFTFTVKKGKEKEFEEWAHEITHEEQHFEGHLGNNWIKPVPGGRDYTVIYKFIDAQHFHKWEHSDIRKKLLKKVEPLIQEYRPQRLQQVTGLETWFTLPGKVTVKPPPRWKMVIATMIGIYPIGLIYQAYLVDAILKLPLLLRPIALSLILTPILTYIIMPQLTKLLQRWLYPKK
ncbi:MAG TPA: antibiotic biosynthesis monooxygenase [Candidatus Saccharimonadales bacterium]|nr:antibiotic biosynthesis monooxygenase [Candidatus Saccharimonadales bacterium]